MARDIAERQLTRSKAGGTCFELATPEDDAEIRRLLRDHPMPGKVSISLERESDYFADANLPGQVKQTIVARDGKRVLCTGSCMIRQRFVNGRRCQVGYLGGLRLASAAAGRFDLLRRGYQFFHALQADAAADFYFTSIAADNLRARQFLERRLPGMPLYEFIGEFVTVVLPINGRSLGAGTSMKAGVSKERFVPQLNEHNRDYQFAPCWENDELTALEPLGLGSADFYTFSQGDRLVGSAALWDQAVFKQTVIRGYQFCLGLSRPVINMLARLTNGLQLPAVDEVLANAFVSHLVLAPNIPNALPLILDELKTVAANRGILILTLGFAAADPRLILVQRSFRSIQYRSRLYVVRWPDCGRSSSELDGRTLAPEVALL